MAPVADELPSAKGGLAVPLPERDDRGRVRSPAAARALAKLPRRRDMVPAGFATDPRFEQFAKWRRVWLRNRRAEVCAVTGGCSHGVGAMLNAASWAYASAEFASFVAAETGNVDVFKTAASLQTSARGHDAMAWELAVKEGEARKRTIDPKNDPFLRMFRGDAAEEVKK